MYVFLYHKVTLYFVTVGLVFLNYILLPRLPNTYTYRRKELCTFLPHFVGFALLTCFGQCSVRGCEQRLQMCSCGSACLVCLLQLAQEELPLGSWWSLRLHPLMNHVEKTWDDPLSPQPYQHHHHCHHHLVFLSLFELDMRSNQAVTGTCLNTFIWIMEGLLLIKKLAWFSWWFSGEDCLWQ